MAREGAPKLSGCNRNTDGKVEWIFNLGYGNKSKLPSY